MATILNISSQVVSGHVGSSASTFALQRLGHNVLSVPTILLSNHPGHEIFAGQVIQTELIQNILKALKDNGKFKDLDAVITGYLPSPQHVDLVADTIADIKSNTPDTIYLCDPVMGDSPKGLYIEETVATHIKERLIPKADIITPNFFEIQWLLDKKAVTLDDLKHELESLAHETVLVTSAPDKLNGYISNTMIEGEHITTGAVKKLSQAPNGTGDFIAALFLGYILNGETKVNALHLATKSVTAVLKHSIGKPELCLIETQDQWSKND